MFKFEMKGLDEFQRKLDTLQKRIKNIDGEHAIPFSELFPQDFIRKNTTFQNIEDMFEHSGFTVNSQEDFKKIPDKEWDNFIASNTKFKNWKEMIDAASGEWIKKKIGL